MSYNKIVNIVKKILEKTNNGSIEWEGTERGDTYQVSFSNFSVRLFPRDNPHTPDTDYIIQIINSDGEIVEEVSDEDLKSLLSEAFTKMKQLHELARRQVMGVEGALDAILSELDDKNPLF